MIWIASYPSSGNTWMRSLLSAMLSANGASVHINQLEQIPSVGSYRLLDEVLGVDTADFTVEEVQNLRAEAHQALARSGTHPVFLKIHDRLAPTPAGRPLVPIEETRGVIYLLRNPLDVVASFANHFGYTLDDAIRILGDNTFHLATWEGGPKLQVPQHLGSWSQHVTSWVDTPVAPVCLVKYEDLWAYPNDTLATVARFAGITADPERIAQAVEAAQFTRLREQEIADGFRERAETTTAFFRRGSPGGWKTELSSDQVNAVLRDHAPIMERFGYLPPPRVTAVSGTNR